MSSQHCTAYAWIPVAVGSLEARWSFHCELGYGHGGRHVDDEFGSWDHDTVAEWEANPAALGPAVYGTCCDLHNHHCEPPSELCCGDCSEASHPVHRPGDVCVLEATTRA